MMPAPSLSRKLAFPPPAGWQRVVQRVAATRSAAWLLAHLLHRIDDRLLRWSHGRHSATRALTGLPLVRLTTIGARSGRPRTVPLLAHPRGEEVFLVASRFGNRKHPGWYHNLLHQPAAVLALDEQSVAVKAREAQGDEYRVCWEQAVAQYAGYAAYRTRAAGRHIPILLLTPIPA
jgi:deazaflavin-dependent oxidoreductase (nitroreductase family)